MRGALPWILTISAFILAYTYLGYPLLLALFARFLSHQEEPTVHASPAPVSVIIAAYNEERHIVQRLHNILAQADERLMEIIVGSDGSTDGTVERARSVNDPRVRVLDFPQNRGRAIVHNDCVAHARGDILVFTDAATEFAPGFLAAITAPFADPSVGCTVGHLKWRNVGDDAAAGESEGLYWAYELWIRAQESRLGILATGTGACMAVRRDLFRPLRPDEDVDFTTVMDVLARGYRVVYVPEAIATDEVPATHEGEIRLRSRIVVKNLVGILRKLPEMPPHRFPAVWWGLFSHKILRWLTPVFLLVAFVTNALLLDEPLYRGIFIAQLAFYGLSLAALRFPWLGERVPGARVAAGFLVMNVGLLLGLIQILRGVRIATYTTP